MAIISLFAWQSEGVTAPPGRTAGGPVQVAAGALLKEYQSTMKEKKGEGLREKCDYFTQNKTEGLTPELILAALEKPVSSDQRADAYVKWQLLSGLQGKFPDTLKARAIKVYRSIPVPAATHPGFNHGSLERALTRNIGIMNKDAETPVNKDVADRIKQYRAVIEPNLSFRDEFYARLTPGYDTYVAALSDVYARVSTGAPANEFWSIVSSAIRSWALTASEPANMRNLASAIEKLRQYVKDDRNKPYYRVQWEKNDNYTGLKWVAEQTIQNDKSMEEVSTWLYQRAQSPASGGLKFKDETDPKGKK